MSKYQLEYASGRPQMYDHTSRASRAKRIVKLLAKHYDLKILSKLTVLDVGASTGIIDNELATTFKKVVGIDIDKGGIEFAKKKFKKKNLQFKIGDAMNLKFGNESFDVVICAQVYEHVPSAKRLFDEIYRVLKPGGACYLAAINKLWPWEPHYNLPFLSWLPKSLANKYVSTMGKANTYYETPMSYWQLENLTEKFKRIDFTPKILSNPKNFGYSHKSIPTPLSQILRFFTPTFFWLLIK